MKSNIFKIILLSNFIILGFLSKSGFASGNDGALDKILLQLKADGMNLDVSSLPRLSSKEWPPSKTDKEAAKLKTRSGIVTYLYPATLKFEDQFDYHIYYSSSDREFWVWRVGGVGMSSDLFGPKKLAENAGASGHETVGK